ncbi:hypothetical protein TCAL_00004 [Tigriopus californicus]|uniref:Vacuolar protein sorting-associated protein 33B n=1 Tax=Tigriopus californicus TaxID=6832 RepID=A0A553PH61_TIGCA|nr:vacuolar protein sorting-associated protein 33B-like [Tigriopus californicus]TRY77023.1 hypothetical protein TCAL_00004 [Tigriopus californicus]|eukprot:TCALIF_00004-PA protein Name:"Similar to VPS33B Vacuolar protein sorting-associated protein 33B (Homo sapiens)" AED:0.17 eAED:0.18 QI:57/1/0.5/1/1/0.5/2/0/556
MTMGLNTQNLLHLSAENFSALLKSISGEKILILDSGILKPLDKIMGMSLLREAGVKTIHRLENVVPASFLNSALQYVFVLFPTIESSSQVSGILAANGLGNANTSLIYVPKLTRKVSLFLEEHCVLDLVRLYEFHWEFFPLDSNVWSMLLPQCAFYEPGVQSDVSNYLMLKCLHSVQVLFGKFRKMSAFGAQSSALVQYLASKTMEESLSEPPSDQDGALDHLVVMDRSLDLLPVLLTPLTYEALLHQVFDVSCGQIELERPKAGLKNTERTVIALSNRDKTFASIRYKPFTSIFSFLSSNARRLKEVQSSAANMNVKEMKDFVQFQLKDLQQQYQSVSMHISASEIIQKSLGHMSERSIHIENGIVQKESNIYAKTFAFLQEAIAREFPLPRVKYIISLLHVCIGGLQSQDISFLKRKILEGYGYDKADGVHKFFLYLESVQVNCVSKHCIDSQITPKSQIPEGNHPSFVFGGLYQPLICSLVNRVLNGGVDHTKDPLPKSVPTTVHTRQSSPVARPNILVLFLGGFTYAEIAALNAIERNTGAKIIVASDIDIQ